MIKLGIIGTGAIAAQHAQATGLVGSAVSLVAAADLAGERLAAFAARFSVPRTYTDPAALITDSEIDLIAVATPPSEHERLVIAALEQGKYVLCEKPLAHSLASARRIADAAEQHPGRLSVAYQLRYDSSYRRMLWLARNGWIGSVQSVAIERHGQIPQAYRWWGQWDVAGGGVLITQLIHQIDLLVLAMGKPAAVNATMETRYTDIESEDAVDATVWFADGTASFRSSVNSDRVGGHFTIYGESGQVGLPWRFETSDPRGARTALRRCSAALPDTRPPSSSFMGRGFRSAARRLGVSQRPELTPHARLYAHIADCIRRGAPLPIPASEALTSLELCMAAYESALLGRQVDLPLTSSSSVYDGVSKSAYAARRNGAVGGRSGPRGPVRGTVRVGLVGLDTSHAPTFARILHDPTDPFHIPGARVVAAYPGGSPDMPISISRVSGFTNEVRDMYGVPIVDSAERVADAADVVLVLSSDGRTHPDLFRAVAGRGKPVFVDKPFAVSSSDARAVYDAARGSGTRWFASSAFRYADGLVSALDDIRSRGDRVTSCRVRCWLPIEETQGRYFWYGIHAAEMLLASMGPGVAEVRASGDPGKDEISVWHADGRTSSIVGSRADRTFAVTLETETRRVEVDLASSMSSLSARLLRVALDVLTEERFPCLWRATETGSVSGARTSRALDPSPDETLEVVGLLDAAQQSFGSGRTTRLA